MWLFRVLVSVQDAIVRQWAASVPLGAYQIVLGASVLAVRKPWAILGLLSCKGGGFQAVSESWP